MHTMQKNWRNKNNINMYDPRQFTMESFYTETHKRELKHSFDDELFNNLHLLSDPLRKNLADSMIIQEEKPKKKNMLNVSLETEMPKVDSDTHRGNMPFYSGVTNFLASVVNVFSGAMAHWRPKPPAQYYDCYDEVSQQGAPQTWQRSNSEVQNKSGRDASSNSKSDMNIDCRAAAAHCEDKINKVRLLLSTRPVETPKFRPRRPRKQFVEARLVEDKFEDAFTPEDFASLEISNNAFIEYYSPFQIHKEELCETASPKIKTLTTPMESTDIVKTLPRVETKNIEIVNNEVPVIEATNTHTEIKCDDKPPERTTKEELVSSCEDKLTKLKALLQEKRKNNHKTVISSDSVQETEVKSNDRHHKSAKKTSHCRLATVSKDKHYKNPNRTTDKRRKCKLKRSIQEDLVFANEINSEELSSVENSPSISCLDRLYNQNSSVNNSLSDTSSTPVDYFDEVSGRFRSTSTTESEDSFQIVFNDSPKEARMRQASDCDSEDSFIVFEESPDSCYTSNEVFGDSDESDSVYTDSESELSDTEDVQVPLLSHTLTRTFNDLTNGNLYVDKSPDEVDCSMRTDCEGAPSQSEIDVQKISEPVSTGLLMTEAKKLLKKNQPPKKVQFSSKPPKVHVMRVWAFAARQARAGDWERCMLDRNRFKRRIADTDLAVSWVLKPQHRSRVMFQRFMPWWNAQKRKELAEKKAKEEEEKKAKEDEEKQTKEDELIKQGKLNENLINGNADSVNDADSDNVNTDVNDKKQGLNDNNGNDSLVKSVDNNNTEREVINDKLDIIKCNGLKNDLNKTAVLNSTVSMEIIPVNEKVIDLKKQIDNEILSRI